MADNVTSLDRLRGSLLSQAPARPQPETRREAEPLEEDACPAFGYPLGLHDRVDMVEFRLRDGNPCLLPLFLADTPEWAPTFREVAAYADGTGVDWRNRVRAQQAGAEGDRLRAGQGDDRLAADRAHVVHRVRQRDRHTAVHGPGAGELQRRGRGYACGHL